MISGRATEFSDLLSPDVPPAIAPRFGRSLCVSALRVYVRGDSWSHRCIIYIAKAPLLLRNPREESISLELVTLTYY